jgi:hydrogenase expression/formation protein HypE
MSEREDIKFESPLASDCAPLNGLIGQLLESCPGIRFMRDPTRGGLAATLNEVSRSTGLSVAVHEKALPVTPTVQAAADMLGFDVLTVANEGKVVVVVPGEEAQRALEALRAHKYGREASVIGHIGDERDGLCDLLTHVGGRRIVQKPYGEDLPRIC